MQMALGNCNEGFIIGCLISVVCFFSVEELVMRADSDIQHLIDVDDPSVTRYTSTILSEGI